MSDIRFNRWLHQSGTGGIYQDGSGRVGIGSSTPNEALSVIGDVSVTGTLNISDGGNLNNPSGIITTGTLSVDSIDGTLSVGTGTSISSGIITTGTLSVGIVTCTELFVNGTLLTGGPPDPVGTIVAWADSTPPTGWLECNGQSTTGYAELAAVVGANVPDLRAEFIRGWDNGRGVDTDRISAGLGIGSSQTDAFQGHKHSSGSVVTTQANANAVNAGSSLKFANNFIGDPSNDGTNGDPRTSSETRPSNIALMYIIKHTTTAAAGATSGSKINQGNTEAEVIDTGSDGHFKVTTDGIEKLRVTSTGEVQIANGNLKFSTAGTGIDFSATADSSGTMTSELLDDYEEGTWIPTLIGSTSNPSLTFSTAAGAYEKIGALVHASFFMNVSAVSSQGSGQLRIGGLPFNAFNNINASEVPAVLLQSEPFTDGDGSNRSQFARTAGGNFLLCGYRNLTTGNCPVPGNAAANVGTGYFIGHVTYRALA